MSIRLFVLNLNFTQYFPLPFYFQDYYVFFHKHIISYSVYRCLKANTDLAPDFFDSNIVADQLQYNGIAEVAKIRKMGYPVRKPYSEFLKRYMCY